MPEQTHRIDAGGRRSSCVNLRRSGQPQQQRRE